jgi:hypothetical protein
MWFPLVAAVAGVAGAILTDIVISRLGMSRTAAYGASLLGGLVATILALLLGARIAALSTTGFGDIALALLLYGAWWFILLNFIQAFDSSLRVQLLAMVNDAGGRLPRGELFRHYNDQVLLELRLARLLKQGYVIERESRLFVASKPLKLLALFFRALKIALLRRRSEFDRPSKT